MVSLDASPIDSMLGHLTDTNVVREPLGASGWLAFPPTLQNDKPDVVVALVQEADELFRRYPIDAVYSSEPRYYRRTPRGRRGMFEAVRVGRITQLIWTTPSRGPGGPGRTGLTDASCMLSLGSNDLPGTVSIVIQPPAQNAFAGLVEEVAAFLTRWFDPLDAANAFVSHYGIVAHGEAGDHPLVTRFERRSTTVTGWHALQRFVRGVFWGMGLGGELCARLGGTHAVLQDAPVVRAQRLGKGVWLQLSDTPPGSPDQFEDLAAYLRPLLGTPGEIRSAHAEREAFWCPTPTTQYDTVMLEKRERAVDDTESSELARKPVPIRGLRDLEVDVALNLYLDRPPSSAQLARLVATMDAWYAEGFEGGFGGAGFHGLDGPSVDGRVARWQVDLGSANGELAIRALAQRLGRLTDVFVKRLVLGTETVG